MDMTGKGSKEAAEEIGVYPTVEQPETLQDSPVHESS